MPVSITQSSAPPKRRQRLQGQRIRGFILHHIQEHPKDIAALTASSFGTTRQAVNKHLARLVHEGLLLKEGHTKGHSYKLAPLLDRSTCYRIIPGLAEHDVWDRDISPLVEGLRSNALDIWQISFTEMFNNAVDHSEGSHIFVRVVKTAAFTEIVVADDGIGIFRKIQSVMGLTDERHAILELSKGKLTTDPEKHTGQGIFFTSRMVDSFDILSGGFFFTHNADSDENWMIDRNTSAKGTTIFMKLHNTTQRLAETVFKQFSCEEGLAFVKTIIPAKLAVRGNEKLVSRSQAKKLMTGLGNFETVLLDFSDVDTIGQAFTDEIFRVFQRNHPRIEISPINANDDIKQLIAAARSNWAPSSG
jgi:anti-sigma regulatory factor (Ser/Thr protein kinase)